MTVQTFDAAHDVLTVTPAAARHFQRQLAGSDHRGIRISLRESGCTGFKYVVEPAPAAAETDVTIPLDGGIAVFLDAKAIPALRGTRIDYAQEGVNFTLRMDNPNVKHACGCGESFSID